MPDATVDDTVAIIVPIQVLEKAIGKEMLKLKEKQEGAVLQTVIAKMRYSESRLSGVKQSNKALARMLHHERHGPRATMPTVRRSQTAMGALGPGLDRSHVSGSASGSILPPLKGGNKQAWGESSERASKKQAVGRTR